MLNPGQVLRQYRVERFIGKGGMGEVYLATDTKLHRKVALKLLSSDMPIDERRKKRFIREAIAASRLTHPNVAVVYDADETEEGLAFISMEYVEGETLASRLEHGPLPIEEVRSFALQIADALDEAHRHGIVHRDIKPGNVMIDQHARVKVLDFGLARVFEEGDVVNSAALTRSAESGSIAGTPAYMSPEQARGERVDDRTDIFSFGLVLYEMITGLSPFAASSPAVAFVNVLVTEPPPIRTLRSDVPPALEQIVSKAMEKDRELRYQSAREIAVDLQRPDRPQTIKRGHWIAPALAAIIAGIAIGVLLWPHRHGEAPPSIGSIAVLPFQNLSPKPEDDYLADGMTEALITDLAQIRALKVISRTSVMQYKKTQKSLPQIGRELGAASVIEGSVVQAGERVRVTAQLIDARTDQHLWAESYDRDLRDVLRLEDEIARTVADRVRVQLLPAEKIRLTRAPQIDPRAHELYVEGRYEWSRRGREGLLRSVDLLNQAINIEPNWALAYAALADSYNLAANNGFLPFDEAFPKGKAATRKALELDPDLGQAHVALAFELWQYDRRFSAAEDEFRHAIDLQPSYAEAHHFFALFLVAFGRDAEGLAEIRKALELDPLAPRINTNYGDILRVIGHEAEAIQIYQKWLSADPNQARSRLVYSYVHQNRPLEAMKTAEEAAATKHPFAKVMKALALASLRHEEAIPFIREVEHEVNRVNSRQPTLICAYVVAGDQKSAWKTLERTIPGNFPNLFLLREPLLEPLRRDPRYPALVEKLMQPR